MDHVPDPGPTDLTKWGAWTERGLHERFLKEHADLISPWAFSLPIRTQIAMARLVRSWQKCVERARGNQ